MATPNKTDEAWKDAVLDALAILADALGRTLKQRGRPESDAYVTETAAFRAVAAALRSQGQAVARADAWRDFALHQVVCGECAHSVSECHIGSELQAAALAQQANK